MQKLSASAALPFSNIDAVSAFAHAFAAKVLVGIQSGTEPNVSVPLFHGSASACKQTKKKKWWWVFGGAQLHEMLVPIKIDDYFNEVFLTPPEIKTIERSAELGYLISDASLLVPPVESPYALGRSEFETKQIVLEAGKWYGFFWAHDGGTQVLDFKVITKEKIVDGAPQINHFESPFPMVITDDTFLERGEFKAPGTFVLGKSLETGGPDMTRFKPSIFSLRFPLTDGLLANACATIFGPRAKAFLAIKANEEWQGPFSPNGGIPTIDSIGAKTVECKVVMSNANPMESSYLMEVRIRLFHDVPFFLEYRSE